KPNNAATIEDKIMIGKVGFLRIEPYKIIIGGSNSRRFQSNILFNVSSIIVIVSGVDTFPVDRLNPAKAYIIMLTTAAGTVVHNICLICSYNSLPAAIGAKFV